MPEGDSLRRTAERLRVLEGEIVAAESPHPRAAVLGVAARIDGLRLERVEAVGKNLLLRFEGGVVVRSHLRLRGRWHLGAPGMPRSGRPWLVLRGQMHEAVLWNGPVLELGRGTVDRLGPDMLHVPPAIDAMAANLQRSGMRREIGDALMDQRLVAGIGNMWRSEALFLARISPWALVHELDEPALRRVLEAAANAMTASRGERLVYRRAGLPCRRCDARIRARRQGEGARSAYWCPGCQAGSDPVSA